MKRIQVNQKKNLKWMIASIIAVATFITCDSPNEPEPEKEVEVAQVTIEQPSSTALASLTAGGGTLSLSVKIEPANATNKTVDWSSSNTAIATVSATGLVTGVTQGKATITATTKSGNKKSEFEIEVKPDPKAQPVELKSPIRENTTLKDLGLEVDYFYAGSSYLIVENNATLTIEPGVTIKFTNGYGGLHVKAGATIKAIGTASKHIQFIGASNEKGSWNGIMLESKTDNQFVYCDLLNAGRLNRYDSFALHLISGAKASVTYCKFTNGNGVGLYIHNYGGECQLTAFNNNVFEDFELPPVYFSSMNLKQLSKFDMTSDFTKNQHAYIEIGSGPDMDENSTINQTTVPYYFTRQIDYIHYDLTINEGVTIYIDDGRAFCGYSAEHKGRLMINGTASKKVKFTRFPGSTKYWSCVCFNGLKGSVINHCIFEYGGTAGTYDGILVLFRTADLTLNNVTIDNAQNYGVVLYDYDYKLKHSNVTFSKNGKGNVWVSLSTYPWSYVNDHFP
jgi:hypothetical protein